MKVPTALVALGLASAAAAQSLPGLPECAQGCANTFLQNGIGNCGSNPKCICEDKSFLGEIACCLSGVCNQEEQNSAVAYASKLCRGMGVTDLPSVVSCSTTAAQTSTSAAAETTSAGAQTTGSVSGSSSNTGSPTGSNTTPAPTGSGAETAGAGAASTSSSTGLGPRPTAAAGLGALGGIMAAVALL